MNENIYRDFQICIIVPLRAHFSEHPERAASVYSRWLLVVRIRQCFLVKPSHYTHDLFIEKFCFVNSVPLDTGHKLNISCTFNLDPMPRGLSQNLNIRLNRDCCYHREMVRKIKLTRSSFFIRKWKQLHENIKEPEIGLKNKKNTNKKVKLKKKQKEIIIKSSKTELRNKQTKKTTISRKKSTTKQKYFRNRK